MTDQPIFIVGVPRSGTSMVAGMLAQMGVWAGDTVGPSPANPKGFFENEMLREGVNKTLLTACGADPLGVRVLPDWTEDIAGLPQDGMREAVFRLMAAQGYKGGPWLFKDCKSLLLAPMWWRAFPEAKWLTVWRKPIDVIRSCINTSFMRQHSVDPAFWNDWMIQYQDRMSDMEAVCDTRSIWPQRLAEGDFSELESICEWLGVEYREPTGFFDAKHWNGSQEGEEPFFSTVMHNTKSPALMANVDHALTLDIPLFAGPQKPHQRPLCLVAGGPSMRGKLGRIRRLQREGATVWALNGSHDFLLRHKIRPDGMVLMDARGGEHNRFLSRPIEGCRYYLASQCSPEAFAAVEGYDVTLWHSDFDGLRKHIEARGHGGLMVLGGCTVGLRALNLALLDGYREIHLFGYDCCVQKGAHHAYAQPQNDDDKMTQVRLGDRTFDCAVWQARQVQDFQVQMEAMGDKVFITIETPPRDVKLLIQQAGAILVRIHGDGVLAELVRYGRQEDSRNAA